MTDPGPWLNPPNNLVRTHELVRLIMSADDSSLIEGISYVEGGSGFGAGLPSVEAGVAVAGSGGGYGVGGARVAAVTMGSTDPTEWGAVTPGGAIGFEWETPAALATPTTTSMPGVVQATPVTITSIVFRPDADPRPAFAWAIRTGIVPLSGITTSGTVVTSATGITGQLQFGVVESYGVVAGTGGITVVHSEDWPGVDIPTGGVAGWAVFVVTADPGQGVDAVGRVAPHRSASTPYLPTSRYRWLYADAGGSYGWGIRLA